MILNFNLPFKLPSENNSLSNHFENVHFKIKMVVNFKYNNEKLKISSEGIVTIGDLKKELTNFEMFRNSKFDIVRVIEGYKI